MTAPTINANRKTKKTAIGELPGGWDVLPLGKCTRLERGKFAFRPRTEPRFYGGKTPFVQTGDVSNARTWIRSYTQTLSDEGLAISKVFPKGAILMTIAANIGDCAMLDFDSACPDSVIGILPRDGVDGLFLLYTLIHRKNHLHYLAPAGAQKNLNLDFLQKVQVPVPPFPEQHRIAAVLGTWDRAIERQEQLLAAKQQFKQSLMQQLLTGKKRFPEFKGQKWRTVHLGDVFTERVEINRTDLPLVAITSDRGVIPRDQLDRNDTSSEDKSKYLRIAPGDIGYNTMRMWQGVSGVSEIEGIVSPAYTICIPQDGIDRHFAGYLFKSRQVIHLFHRHSQGLVKDTLNLKFPNFARIRVTLPPVKEQKKIAGVLRVVDRELALIAREADALRDQKRGLMQQLLTGKVRVKG